MPANEQDIKYMRLALDEARRAATLGEVPVGAIIVCKNQIVGRGHNLTETLNDVTPSEANTSPTAPSTSPSNPA